MEQELLEVCAVFKGAWELIKQYPNPTDTGEYWTSLQQAAQDFTKRHGKTKLSIDLAVTVLRELERRGQRKETENDWKGGLGRDSRAITGNITGGEAKEQAS